MTRNKQSELLIVVGIGASAGGLNAIEEFFKNTIPSKNKAYVVIQHLNPKYESMMQHILQKHTKITVQEIKDGEQIKANNIYLKPPDKDIILKDQSFLLLEPKIQKGFNLPIDRFFISLAKEMKENAIGVILSGTGTDGTIGLKEIKGEGGIIFVQDPNQSEYPGMPESALGTKQVDFCLPTESIPLKIREYTKSSLLLKPAHADEVKQHLWETNLKKILNIVQEKTGHDFSDYKANTLNRRIKRRIGLHQLDDIKRYLKFLDDNDQEIDLLFRDLTIKVTSFFRDPEAFETLKEKAIMPLIQNKVDESILRIWVPGCDTGEEAYSIAILCAETMKQLNKPINIQIFASDIDGDAIENARKANYPQNIITNISKQRLQQFFIKTESSYTVKKNIREMVVFAEQSIIKDPPFSKLDLVSCRNVLIYLNTDLQKKIIPLFYYVLRDDGILFIGLSESIGEFTNLFQPVHQKHRVFKRKTGFTNRAPNTQFIHQKSQWIQYPIEPQKQRKYNDFSIIINRILIDQFTPATVVIDENFEILYFSGQTNKYISNPKGHRNFNAIEMARWGLKTKIREGVQQAQKSKTQIRYQNCQVKLNGVVNKVNLVIDPLVDDKTMMGLTLLVFEEVHQPSVMGIDDESSVHDFENLEKQQLRQELQSTWTDLQATIEELETSNEELQSVNEELQSTNEEMETSREELQATNEELSSVNIELQRNIEELSQAKDYVNNLLENTNIATIFLDTDLQIIRFTPQVKKIFNLRETDINRPLDDITTKLTYQHINKDIKEVLDTLERKEIHTSDETGNVYEIRMIPYRTMDNRIIGIVISIIDVTELTNAKNFAEGIVDTIDQPLLILTSKLTVYSANQTFYQFFKTKPGETEGMLVYDLGNSQWDIPDLRKLLEEIIPQKSIIKGYVVEHVFPRIGKKRIILNCKEISMKGDYEPLILIMMNEMSQMEDDHGRQE